MPPAAQARLALAIPGDGRARRLLEGLYVSHDEVRRCRPNATPRTPVPAVIVVPVRNASSCAGATAIDSGPVRRWKNGGGSRGPPHADCCR